MVEIHYRCIVLPKKHRYLRTKKNMFETVCMDLTPHQKPQNLFGSFALRAHILWSEVTTSL
jgi:hypothetical protein